MGAGYSTTSSYQQYKNDFELVIRATKDLEHLLEKSFNAPSGKQIGLHDKITHVQSTERLSNETVKKMRYLVTCTLLGYDFRDTQTAGRVIFFGFNALQMSLLTCVFLVCVYYSYF